MDLVVQHSDSIILGKLTKRPAKGEWFVPGGAVHKHERLLDAAHRIAQDELSIDIQIARQLGVYEHFYNIAEVNDIGGKHSVTVAFVGSAENREVSPDDQHTSFRWFTPPFETIELHPYVKAYLEDAGILHGSV